MATTNLKLTLGDLARLCAAANVTDLNWDAKTDRWQLWRGWKDLGGCSGAQLEQALTALAASVEVAP